MPGHEVELWVPQFHLGTPAAHASNAVPPFQVVTPASPGLMCLKLRHLEIS